MPLIKMAPDEARNLAKIYNVSAGDVQVMMQKLQATQGQLAEVWEGDAYAAFEMQFNGMKPTIQRFSELLEDVYQQLMRIAQIIETTDQNISQEVQRNS